MSSALTAEGRPRISLRDRRWTHVGIPLFVTYLVCFMDRTNIGVAAPHIAMDLQVGAATVGVLLSAFFWGYVLSGVPAGAWANRGQAKNMVVVCMVLIALSAGATGLVGDLGTMLVARVVLGLAEGAIFPAFTVLFLNWFPARERALAVALTIYAIPFSSAVMAPLAGWLIDVSSWRVMFVVQAAPALLIALWLGLCTKECPERDRRLGAAERAEIVSSRDEQTTGEASFREAFLRPTVWLLGGVYFLWAMGIYALTLWLPTVIGELTGGSATSVGLMTAVPFLAATLTVFLITRLAVGSRYGLGMFVIVPVAAAGLTLLAQHVVSTSPVLEYAMLIVAASLIYGAMGIWWTWVMQNVPRNHTGACVGLVNGCGNLGGLVGPIIIGFAAVDGDTSSGLYIIGVAGILAAGIATIVHRRNLRTETVSA